MKTNRSRTIAAISLAVLAVPAVAAASNVGHEGNPQQWGPPLEEICANFDTAAAAAAGYNVFVLNNNANVFNGTAFDDAIFALGGNDVINALGGDDLVCLGRGNDRGRGASGNDAVFGEEGYDRIQGNVGNDHLDGGTEVDSCSGGADFDTQNNCETWVQ